MIFDNIMEPETFSGDVEDKTSIRYFEERSDLAREIVSRKPDFFERWALLLLLGLIITLFGSTWFIKYPDIVHASAVVTGTNAPKEIVAKQTGKIVSLFTRNNATVKQGDILFWMESGADVKEVTKLSGILRNVLVAMNRSDVEMVQELLANKCVNLGELQGAYGVFVDEWLKFRDYAPGGFFPKKRDVLYEDLASLRMIKSELVEQRNISTEDHELAKSSFEMNKRLYQEKVISAEEYRKAQSFLLSKGGTLPQAEVSLTVQQSNIREKQKEIDQLDHDIKRAYLTFDQAIHKLKSEVDQWVRQYSVQAPADGAVVLGLPIQVNQYIEQNKVIGYINPTDSKFYAEIRMSQANFGKVDTGMKVQLRLAAYPYQESGYLRGKVDYISDIAVDSGFLGTVRLVDGMKTNQSTKIHFRSGLKGDALIITRDLRLLERIYYAIVKSTTVSK